MTIQNMIVGLASNLCVIIASLVQGEPRLSQKAQDAVSELPTLIFSPTPLSRVIRNWDQP